MDNEEYEKAKDVTMKDYFPRSVGAQYAIGEDRRNNTSRNEETDPKQKQRPAVDVTEMEVKSNAVRNNIAQEPEMLGP